LQGQQRKRTAVSSFNPQSELDRRMWVFWRSEWAIRFRRNYPGDYVLLESSKVAAFRLRGQPTLLKRLRCGMRLLPVRQLVLSVLVVFFTVVALAAHHSDDWNKEAAKPGEKVFWVDPGDPSMFDFSYGAAGSEWQPRPPFSFVKEDLSRTTPKLNVIDSDGVAWNVKWGEEASPSVFCTRLAGACGYLVEPEYFVARGRIENVGNLSRARRYVAKDGSFINARFQLRTDSPKYLQGEYWPLNKNPFLG